MLIGCGNIGGGFDRERATDLLPLTHAGAYLRHGGYELKACVEPDEAKRINFMRQWAVPEGFSSVSTAIAAGASCDVVSICSPTESHAENLECLLGDMRPRLIFCEKPVTETVAKTARLVAHCESMGVSLAVNHNRRWDPAVMKLRDDLKCGRRGPLRTVVGFYNKGILNNGSHMFDLLRFLLGDLSILSVGQAVVDYLPEDPTLPVSLQSASGAPVFLCCGDSRDYAFFELQFVFSSGVLSIEDGGQSWRERIASPSDKFSGYNTLGAGRIFPGGDEDCMLDAVSNIYCHLAAGEELLSTGRTALAAQRLCEQAHKMALTTAVSP